MFKDLYGTIFNSSFFLLPPHPAPLPLPPPRRIQILFPLSPTLGKKSPVEASTQDVFQELLNFANMGRSIRVSSILSALREIWEHEDQVEMYHLCPEWHWSRFDVIHQRRLGGQGKGCSFYRPGGSGSLLSPLFTLEGVLKKSVPSANFT